MYQAELRGKLSKRIECSEDILTSNVFSFLKYSDRKLYLQRFLLDTLNIRLDLDELHDADIQFWPIYQDGTEPDVIIKTVQHYVLVEAKYKGGIEISQIRREMAQGLAEAKRDNLLFHYLLITKDYSRPNIGLQDSELPIPLNWTNWQNVCGIIEESLINNPESISPLTYDLYKLLLHKNLRSFRSFLEIQGHIKSQNSSSIFFNSKSALYRGSFIGFSDILSAIPSLSGISDCVFYSQKRKYWANIYLCELDLNKNTVFFRRNNED